MNNIGMYFIITIVSIVSLIPLYQFLQFTFFPTKRDLIIKACHDAGLSPKETARFLLNIDNENEGEK